MGLRLRSVGENPVAADAAGINVYRTRLIAVVVGAIFAALSGAYLSLDQHGRFIRYMQTGGFTAIAIVVFGNWNPLIVLGGGIVFGLGEALVSRVAPALGVGIAPQFLQMIPLVLTILIYSARRRTTAPEALGKPYAKE
jgi:simple sugar transport system permease protein